MEESRQFLVFTLDEQRYAIHLQAVDRVLRIMEITPLPKAPEIVLGVINLGGRVIAVINARRRFSLAEREIALTDQLIIAKTASRSVALVADSVTGIVELPARASVAAAYIVPGTKYLEGVLKFDDGMVLIHDLEKFLSLEEEKILGRAMSKAKN